MKRNIVFLLLFAMLLSGCIEKAQAPTTNDNTDKNPTETSEDTSSDEKSNTPIATASNFGNYEETDVDFTPQVEKYAVKEDLSNIINTDDFGFSDSAKELLVKNNFVVVPAYNSEFYSLYENNRYDYYPNFITTDSILHNYHLMFDHLLKTLEEPPPHVIFIFATTEPQSLPATILSRTQRFDFKRVPISALAETVNDIAAKEGLEIDPRAALMVARKADGSLRDALSLLDQLINFSQGMITTESASEILGLVKTDFLFKIIKAVIKHDTPAVLEMFNVYFDEGVDIDGLADELSIFLGKLLLVKNGVRETSILEMDISELEKAELLVSEIDTSDILRMLQIMADFTVDKKSGVDPVVAMEVALVRLSGLDKAVDIDELLSNLSNPVNMTRALSGHSVSKVVKATKSTSAEEGRSMDVGRKSGQAPFTRSQSTAIEHKLDNISNWWSNFLSFVKSKSLAVWSHLQYAKVSYNGSNLVDLGFPLGNEFHMKFLTGRRSFIIDCLKEFSGANPGVSFTRLENENNDLTDIPNIPKQSIEEFLNQHPKMKKLHDLIDGDDIRFRGNMQ